MKIGAVLFKNYVMFVETRFFLHNALIPYNIKRSVKNVLKIIEKKKTRRDKE